MSPDTPTETAPSSLPEFNPYQPPVANIVPETTQILPENYPGIGRLAFFGSIILIGILSNALAAASRSAIAGMLVMVLALFPSHSRLKNIGRNPNWCFLIIVPILSLFITIPCLVLPAGYQYHRKLDTPAKIIAILCVAFLIFLAYALLA